MAHAVERDPERTDATDEPVVLFETRGAVAFVTLNRPAKRNAISPDVARLIEAALDQIENTDEILVGVLCSRGDGAFSAGADLNYVAAGRGAELSTPRGGFAGIARYPRTKPIVCAVQGVALGGGFEIAMACDIVIAERDCEFGLPEVTRGIIPNGGGLLRLPRFLPRPLAMDMILTGARMSAERAAVLGVVSRLVEAGQSLAVAASVAEQIASYSAPAVRACIEVADLAGGRISDDIWAMCAAAADRVRRNPAAIAQARRFVERT